MKWLFSLQAETRGNIEVPGLSKLENEIVFHLQSLQFAKDPCKI